MKKKRTKKPNRKPLNKIEQLAKNKKLHHSKLKKSSQQFLRNLMNMVI
jgi:hypothetical protein